MMLPSTSCGAGLGEGNGCLPTTPQREATSSSRKKLRVGVQDVVGEFCKHVRVRLPFRMFLWSRLGAALET